MEQNIEIEVSCLDKTWFIDLDGTVLKHNGFDSKEELLPGVKEFFSKNIRDNDVVIFTTARRGSLSTSTKEFLKNNDIRFDQIIFDLPGGERFVLNDNKPSGLKTAFAINLVRDEGLKNININLNKEL